MLDSPVPILKHIHTVHLCAALSDITHTLLPQLSGAIVGFGLLPEDASALAKEEPGI